MFIANNRKERIKIDLKKDCEKNSANTNLILKQRRIKNFFLCNNKTIKKKKRNERDWDWMHKRWGL